MLFAILRAVWRLTILLLGAYTVYFTVFLAFPYVDDRLPLSISLFLLYCFVAYGAIPALIRLWRVVFKPNHIPMYATTPDGWPADPVNIAVIANSEKHFVESMQRAGWYTADKSTFKNMFREALAIALDRSYPTAPFSNLYLFGRSFDIGFQLPRSKSMSPRARHHVRFWRLTADGNGDHQQHYNFWHDQFKHLLGTDKEVWIGAALDDTGPIGIRWRTGQITHKNDSNDTGERDFIIETLAAVHQIRQPKIIQAGEPFKFRGQALGTTFVCDGSIKLVKLKNPIAGAVLGGHPIIK